MKLCLFCQYTNATKCSIIISETINSTRKGNRVENMTKYKGYYIDKVVFNNKAEIDAFIKKQTIEKYQTLCRMFARNSSMELIAMMQPYADRLHNEFGLSYEEIEQLEIEAYAA